MQEIPEKASNSHELMDVLGSLLSGTTFILFAMWWIYSMYDRYFTTLVTQYSGELIFYWNTLTFTCSRWPNIPVEGVCLFCASICGVIGDALNAPNHIHWLHIGSAYRITIFAFFGLCGFLDIVYSLMKYNIKALPADVDFAVAVLAFCVEAFLIQQHLSGHTPLYIQVYTLQYSTALLCAFFTALEMVCKRNLMPAIGRAYFTMLQGTWLIQIAFILHGPNAVTWDHDSMEDIMYTSVLYTWHMGILAVFFLVLSVIVLTESRKIESDMVMNELRRSESLSELDTAM